MSFLDARLGNTPRWYIEAPKDALMRVPDAVLKAVCFLGLYDSDVEGNTTVKLGGTGFLVLHVSEFDPGIGHLYLVTANHVADALINREFAVRLNSDRGDAIWIRGSRSTRWYDHPTDRIADVAVMPFGLPSNAEYVPIPTSMFVDRATIEKGTIGPGDEVFVTGLFTHLPGMLRQTPVVRTGNIAMLPAYGEKVPTERGFMYAYLIEARSIGGVSGSPVFVCETINIKSKDSPEGFISGSGPIYFMGLMHGHWDIPPEAKNDALPDREGKVNMGIAIVVPASTILEVINQDELMAERRRAAKRRKKELPLPTMDSSGSDVQKTRAGIDILIPTKASFIHDLEKATRRKKPSE